MAGLTFGQIQQRCLDRLGGNAVRDAELLRKVKAFINDEYRAVCVMRNWPWLISTGSVALTSATVDITLPADCRFGGVIHVTLGSTGAILPYTDFPLGEVESKTAMRLIGRGPPAEWTMLGASMRTLPYSSGADTLHLVYHVVVVDMVLDSEEPVVPDNHRGILVDGAMSRLSAADSFDETIATRAHAAWKVGIRALCHTARQASPRIFHLPRLHGHRGGGQF